MDGNGGALTSPNTSTPTLPQPLRSELDALLEPPRRPVYGDGGQFDLVEGEWKPPANPSPAIVVAAQTELQRLNVLSQPAAAASVQSWLGSLGVLCAGGKTSVTDAALKLQAYSDLLAGRYSAGLFTKASLGRARREFSWFPTFAEVASFLDREAAAFRVRERRLAQILTPRPAAKPVDPPLSAEERAAMRARIDEHLAKIGIRSSPEREREEAAA